MDQEYKNGLSERIKHSRQLATREMAKAWQYREIIHCCQAADAAEELALQAESCIDKTAESCIKEKTVHAAIKAAQEAERAAQIAETSSQIAGCLGTAEPLDNVTQAARRARDAEKRATMAALVVIGEYLMQDREEVVGEDMSLWAMVEEAEVDFPKAVNLLTAKGNKLAALQQALRCAQDVVKGARKLGDQRLVALKGAEAAGIERAVRLMEEEQKVGGDAAKLIELFSTKINNEMEKAQKINNDLRKELNSAKSTILEYRMRIKEAQKKLKTIHNKG